MSEFDKNLKRIGLSLLMANPLNVKISSKIIEMTPDIANTITQLSRRDFLKLSGLGFALLSDIPEAASTILRAPDGELISEFAGNVIAEAGTGTVSKLQLTRSDLLDQIVLRKIAQQNITPARGKVITTQLYNMVGTTNDADFVIASEIDHATQIPTGRSWVAFGVKEVGIDSSNQKIAALKPPTIFGQMKFIEMDVVDAGDGKIALGAVSELGGVSPLFVFDVSIGSNGNTTFDNPKFLPPFTDQVNSGPVEAPRSLNRHARVKKTEVTESPEPGLSPEIVSSAQEYFGENFEITADGKVIDKVLGQEIQGFTIVPFNEQTMIPPYKKDVKWGWQRVYQFEDNPDFTVVGTEADVTVTETNGLDMYAWGYEKGEFKRQNIEFAAANGGTVEIEGFSPQEVQQMIINDSSTDPKYRASNSYQSWRSLALNIPTKVSNRTFYMTYKGMWEPYDNYYYWYGNNFIPAVNPDGSWSAVETTGFVVSPEFKDRSKALVVWMNKNDKPVIVAMQGKYLEMPQYFNPYWQNRDIEKPFNP